jgi:parallel beta-helix repeat protein
LGVQDGILIYSYSSNTISDNIVSFNTNTGVSIYLSSGNFLSNNLISNNYQGISISFSGNNVFSENTISNNSVGVIISPNSNNNVFYHNNFLDNANPTSTTGSVNVWDSGGEGNYWSRYQGHDEGKDGIGDTAYNIDVANHDNKPLIGMFYSFSFTFAHESFLVSIISNSSVTDFKFETGVETGNQIISFNVDGEDGTNGFSRIGIPVQLMNYSLILVGGEETSPSSVDKPDKSYKYLYFTYAQSLQTVTIISSKTVNMYYDLLAKYNMTQTDLQNLNETYLSLLDNYTDFLNEYSQLQQRYIALNSSYYAHLLDYDQNLENMRNLMYIFAAATAVLIVTTIYLSKRAHTLPTEKIEGGK